MLFSSSCKKGWLEVTSGSEIKSDEQFKSEGGFKDALIGVYLGMTDKSLYAKEMTWNVIDIMAQQYGTLSTLSQYSSFQTYNYTALNARPKLDAFWNKSYNAIANIDNALSNIDKNKSVLNPINYSIIKGELLGLRAFLHFDLMRIYGYGDIANRPEVSAKLAIPYVTEFKKEIIPQLSYAKTFELLNKDLEEALNLLKEDPIYNSPKKPASYYVNVNRDGFYNKREQRMNYYAVKALQARVLLWQGGTANLSKAAAAAEEVIKDSPAKLISATSDVSTDPVFYAEHLFNLNINAFAEIINPSLDASVNTNYNALFLTPQRAEELYETSNPNVGVADVRFNTLLSSQALGLVSIKFQQKPNFYVGRNTLPMIKIPEMYYIAAEYYATNNTTKAVDYLNKVRESRGIVEEISMSASPSQIKLEIDKEYRKEFIMEGQLFFYYKRLGKTTFPGLSSTIVVNDKIYLVPFPDSEIEFGNRVQ